MTNKKRVQYLEAAGRALYGERWQSPMARALGCSQALLSRIASGDRDMTDDIVMSLFETLDRESGRLDRTRTYIDNIRAALAADIRRSK